METIINKAIEGRWNPRGWKNSELVTTINAVYLACFKSPHKEEIDMKFQEIVLDPLFWQALSKACGWEDESLWRAEINGSAEWYLRAMCFHEINLTQGFDKGVKWLEELVTS